MTEARKQEILTRVKTLLDETDKIRVCEAVSVRDATGIRDTTRRFEPGDTRYLLIAVGPTSKNEDLAVGLLSSVIQNDASPY